MKPAKGAALAGALALAPRPCAWQDAGMSTAADLAIAQRHVDGAILRLAGQRLLVERIEAFGHDSRQGQRLLDAMEDTLRLMVEHRDEIEAKVNRTDRALIRPTPASPGRPA